jgi:hypothetical protein
MAIWTYRLPPPFKLPEHEHVSLQNDRLSQQLRGMIQVEMVSPP